MKRRLEQAFADKFAAPLRQKADQTEIWIGPGELTAVMTRLHDDEQFEFEILSDLAGVDTGTEMWVVYHLWSPRTPDWLRVIVPGLNRDDPRVPSVTFIWKGAEWPEREAYDMFGIIFEGNRDLRRIYMPPDPRVRASATSSRSTNRRRTCGVRPSARRPPCRTRSAP